MVIINKNNSKMARSIKKERDETVGVDFGVVVQAMPNGSNVLRHSMW